MTAHAQPAELSRVLDPAECLALLETDCVGRVVHTRNALPAITPVNYRMSGHHIVIRTKVGSSVAHEARSGSVVAFEVDDIDRETERGWSVVVVGVARIVSDGSDLIRATQTGVRPFAGGDRDTYVTITPGTITGRKVG